MSDTCQYPNCRCPFDMGADNLCLIGKPNPDTRPSAPVPDGLPPVGHECKIDIQGVLSWHTGDRWRDCEVLAHRGGKAICWIPTCNTVGLSSNAEHFRTKAESKREDVIESAHKVINSFPFEETDTAEKAFGLLYDAGLLRPATQGQDSGGLWR